MEFEEKFQREYIEDSCLFCGEILPNYKNEYYCKNCGEQIYKENKPPNFGGWLIVLAIGILISALLNLSVFIEDVTYDIDQELAAVGYENETITSFKELAIFENIFNLFIVVLSFYAIYLFYGKRKSFPKFYVYYLTGILVFVFLDSYVILGIVNSSATHQFLTEDYLELFFSRDVVRHIMYTIF